MIHFHRRHWKNCLTYWTACFSLMSIAGLAVLPARAAGSETSELADPSDFPFKMRVAFHSNEDGAKLGPINTDLKWISSHGECTAKAFFHPVCRRGRVDFHNDSLEHREQLKGAIIEAGLMQAKRSLEIYNRLGTSKRIRRVIDEVESRYHQKTLVQTTYKTDVGEDRNEIRVDYLVAGKTYVLLNRELFAFAPVHAEEVVFQALVAQKQTIINEIQFQKDVNHLLGSTVKAAVNALVTADDSVAYPELAAAARAIATGTKNGLLEKLHPSTETRDSTTKNRKSRRPASRP